MPSHTYKIFTAKLFIVVYTMYMNSNRRSVIQIEYVYSIYRIYIRPIRITELNLPWIIPIIFYIGRISRSRERSKAE